MNRPQKELRQMAKVMGRQPNIFRLWLKHGQPGRVAPLTADEQAYVDNLVRGCGGERAFKVSQCWMNAQRMMLHDRVGKQLHYWEGWFTHGQIPISAHHAWLTINGKIVDLTAAALKRKYGYADTEYFGMEIARPELMRFLTTMKLHSPMSEGRWAARLFGLEE